MNNNVLPIIFAATIVTYISQFAPPRGELTIEPLIGMFVIGVLLLMMGLWSPELATAFAVLILLTSMVINGGKVFTALGNVGK